MKHNKYRTLETQRLFLRTLEAADWESISFLRSDKRVNQYVRRENADTKKKALNFIARITMQGSREDSFYWCLSLKNDREMIGSICLWNFSADRQSAEIGYDLNPKFQAQGMMTEAVQAVLSFGFQELGLEKIEAFTQRRNESSKKLLLRNLFQLNKDRIDEGNPKNLIFEIHSIKNNQE